METKIQAIHFSVTEKLEAYIQKKLEKLEKKNEDLIRVAVTLKVVKPQTAMNKETAISVAIAGGELRAEHVADTFEEGVDQCCDSLLRQLSKYKETHK